MSKKSNNKVSTIFPVTMMGITVLTGAILMGNKVSADNTDVVDNVEITVPVSCSMSGTGMDSHEDEVMNGTYQADIGTTTIHAFCNDAEGFAIYAAGFTGDEIGGENSNKLVGTPAGIGNIETGTSTGDPDVSNWAMKLAITQDSGETTGTNAFTIDSDTEGSFSSYHTVPNEYTKVAHKESATDMTTSTGGVKLTTTYAVYISKNQPAGTYAGQVKYTLVHPADAAAPIVPMTIEDAYSKAGKTKLNGYYKIQDMNSTICSNVNQYSGDGMAEVIDVRDNKVYHIAKLLDDRCWMLDNLALDPTDPATAENMDESNTNATAEAINNLLHGGSANTGWSNTAVADVDSGFDSWTAPMINNASKDTLVTSYGPASTNGQAKVGIYYNYCAASVGTFCYDGNSGADIPGTLIDAPQDVCPANWRMPTGGSNSEYDTLIQEYSTIAVETNSLQYNISAVFSGRYYNGLADEQGFMGYLWSSTYSSGSYLGLSFRSNYNYIWPYIYPRNYGQSVRCLAAE